MSFDPLSAILEFGGKVLERVIPDPTARAAAQVELAKLQQTGELTKLVEENKLSEAFLADTASARDREVKISTAPDAPLINKIVTPILAIGIVTLTFLLCGILAFTADGDLKPAQERLIIFLIGAVVPICVQVVSYYFGSSRGDAAKDQHLREMMKNGH